VRTLQEADFSSGWQALNTLVQQAFENGAHPDQIELLSPNGVRAALVLRDNLSHRWHIERMYRKAIASARQDIWIANAYFLPGFKLRKALMHAARRGVRVRLLLQGRWKYVLQRHAVRQVYGELLAAGVEICEYVPSELHAKVAVVDGRWATVGSSNLDPLSLLMAREANMVVVDDDFAKDLAGRLQHAAEHECRWIDAHTLQQRSFWDRRLDAGAFALVRMMLFVLGQRY
jgi:cardiolipin synthase